MQLCNYFLQNYKGYSYSGSLGKDKDNCEIYKWTNGYHTLEGYDCLSLKDGKAEKVFFFIYRLPVSDISYFKESLRAATYEIYKEFISGDGYPMTMWTLFNSSKISAVMVGKKGDYFEITSH